MSVDIQIVSVIGANGQPLPVHGNSIGSNWSAPVKQERADEAEIQELAAKMLESQKAALAKQQQQAVQQATRQAMTVNGAIPPNTNGQTNILNYLSRQQKLPNGTAPATVGTGPAYAANGRGVTNGNGSINGSSDNGAGEKKAPCDEESQKGHFGWTTFGKTYIPYIYRAQEKYCSVRMIELKLLSKYLNCLHHDIYSSCTCVRSYYITEAEAKLLIEINSKHCDGEFGRDMFTQKDLVVRLSDATMFYQFLDICYRKLISGSKSPSEKCGFIRINKESVVPYTVHNSEQVVPLFYFEGETENLKQKADYLTGWDLAYLKFCCKVQGIRNELFSSENVAVISLTDIKSYFPNGTEFEDYWPSKVVDSNLLIGNRSNAATNSVNWTRQPAQPPPKMMSQTTVNMTQKSSLSAAAAAQQQSLLKHRSAAGASAAAAAAAAANVFNAQTAAVVAAAMQQQQQPGQQRMHSNAALTQATVQALNGLTNGSWMSQPPLLHAQMLASQAQQSHANSRNQYRNPMENLMLGNRQSAYTAYNNAAISMQPVNSHSQGNAPPPLVRSASGQNANHMSNVEQTMLQHHHHHQQQQQHHQQQQQRLKTSSSQLHPNTTSHTPMSAALSSDASPAAAAAAAVAAAAAAASSTASSSSHNLYNFNLNSPSGNATAADYSNLALWNQLTPAERLILTQQIKNNGSLLDAVTTGSLGGGSANASNIARGNANNRSPYLPFTSLPLDTDLKTMLDYNPHKAAAAALAAASGGKKHSSANGSTVGLAATAGQFTKPSVPALIPVNNVPETGAQGKRTSSSSATTRQSCVGTASQSSSCSVPLNSSLALEDFEKKFKMTEEMKAVVQKVLSNPDLSTFIQTNSSNTFVPFISPPISPATGSGGGGGNNSAAATALSLLNNPNVTITPQLPAHFVNSSVAHSPSSASSAGSVSVGGGGSARQKSVICSTNAAHLNVPPSPTTLNSTATPSPSPTRLVAAAASQKYAYNAHHPHTTFSSSSSAIPPATSTSYLNGQQQQHAIKRHYQRQHTPPMEVIDLSSPRRSSLQAAYMQQQQQQQHQAAAAAVAQQQAAAVAAVQQQAAVAAVQQQAAAQQQRLAAAAQHHSQQNGRSTSSSSSASSASQSAAAAAAAAAAANPASMHLQRQAALAAAAAAADSAQRLCVIPEIAANNVNVQPYKVQKVYVDNHLVPCINMKAYNDSDQLMTLTDFQKYFFSGVPLEQCKRLIEALGVELYKGNRRQIQILMENDRTHNENIPLVQVRDIMKYMTQLTFMIRNQEQPPSKRSRVS